MAVHAGTQDDPIDDPTPAADDPASGTDPEPEPVPSPDEPEPESDPDAKVGDPDDDEPNEWRYLVDRFSNIKDETERKKAIGAAYLEKTRYSTQTKKENERLTRELEEARSKPAARDEPDEPPAPHPDVERLDYRLQQLEEKDQGLYDKQQSTLVSMGKAREDIAAAKALLEEADEGRRAQLEGKIERLQERQENLSTRLDDLGDRREDLGNQHGELKQQRKWAEDLISQQRKDDKNERQSQETFKAEFPTKVFSTLDKLADAAGIDPEDETLRTDLKETVKDRLTVKFWRLGAGREATDKDVDGLIEEEFERYKKGLDLKGRKDFGKRSKEKLSVAGKRPSSTPKPKPQEGAPVTPDGYDAEPKDVTALGIQELSPTMKRGREALRRSGY